MTSFLPFPSTPASSQPCKHTPQETNFWEQDYEDIGERVASTLEGLESMSVSGDEDGDSDTSGDQGAESTADRASASNSAAGPGGVESKSGKGAGDVALDSAEYNFRFRATWDVVIEEVCIPCGDGAEGKYGDGGGGSPIDTMPTNNELRRFCDVLIYSWHQQELQQTNRNVFMLVDQGRVRRRFGHDWAGYFRFRLERFPAVALMMLASLSSRPKTFYLDSYERRTVSLAVLQVALNAHENAFVRGGTYFSISRCAACDAMRAAAEKRKKAAALRANLPSSPSEAAPGGDDDTFSSHSAIPPRNGMLKRVTSLPVMSMALDRRSVHATGDGGDGDSLKSLVDGAVESAPEHGPTPAAPNARPTTSGAGEPRSQDSHAAPEADGNQPGSDAGSTKRASRARLFFRNSLQSFRNLMPSTKR